MTEGTGHRKYVIGVMSIDVEGKNSDRFHRWVGQAVQAFDDDLARALGLRVDLMAFAGPHMAPTAGAYAPFDFLRIGLSEKLERHVHFLLIVTEVDLAATTLSYTLALPSPLTNVGVVSTERLDPAFWVDPADHARVVRRLTTLLLHTFGHLLNLPHADDADNAMYDVADVNDLDRMATLADAQRQQMRRALPLEAHERTSRDHHWRFALHTLVRDWRSILRAVARANPLHLVTRLPTMITAALSVIIATQAGAGGTPGAGNLGVIQSGAVEESNIDLTAELVNMMVAQRIYQANAQTIKTQDSVLQTLVNLR
jgi:hypothetical protein